MLVLSVLESDWRGPSATPLSPYNGLVQPSGNPSREERGDYLQERLHHFTAIQQGLELDKGLELVLKQAFIINLSFQRRTQSFPSSTAALISCSGVECSTV